MSSARRFDRSVLVEAITTEEQRRRLEKILEERSDIRVLNQMLGASRMLEWLHTVGVCADEELARLSLAVPEREHREIVASADPEMFLWTGLVDVSNLLSLYFKYRGEDVPEVADVLDFGAGCGRLVRFLDPWGEVATSACDVNPDHVEWCSAHLPNTTTRRSGVAPPLPFADGSFHLVYALSVFTHLPERACADFLSDLARVLTPSGILLLTTHGRVALERMVHSKPHRDLFGFQESDVRNLLERFAGEVLVFQEYPETVLELAKAGSLYGSTFTTEAYIRRRFDNEQFAVVDHIPGGIRNWQDITVLRRRY